MSHLKERKDKTCLNCYAQVVGRYCHVCGQENLEPKESFWHLVTHFVYDVTHFDGKFFLTLKYLLLKPGYLANEYLKGRRTSYLHPIRMYVFASAIFFIIFLSFIVKPEEVGNAIKEKEHKGINVMKQSMLDSINLTNDTAKKKKFAEAITILDSISTEVNSFGRQPKTTSLKPYRYQYNDSAKRKNSETQPATLQKRNSNEDDPDYNTNSNFHLVVNNKKLAETTRAAYDSAQAKLPPTKRDGWFTRTLNRRVLDLNEKYHGDKSAFLASFLESFLHSIPKMMFVSVPFVALVMQLLYIRRRKQFFYVNHVVFIIYVYIAAFISLLVYFGFQGLYKVSNFAPFYWLEVLVIIFIYLYLYLAMRNFYKQGYIKTFFKYFILLFVCLILSVFIVSIFALTSLMEV